MGNLTRLERERVNSRTRIRSPSTQIGQGLRSHPQIYLKSPLNQVHLDISSVDGRTLFGNQESRISFVFTRIEVNELSRHRDRPRLVLPRLHHSRRCRRAREPSEKQATLAGPAEVYQSLATANENFAFGNES
ncbi:hypothetical protein WG66_010099 [Moniliophthora roreri]|nr:hypothetical protein WG66_010099 [Moniliophthora roreri]